MAFKNIIVPVDGSEGSNRALEMAMQIADGNGNVHFDVVYVVPIPSLPEVKNLDTREIIDMMREDGRKILTEAIDFMGEAGAQADAVMLEGTSPAAQIVKLAEQRDYDLIIIGNRGLSGRKEFAGSVSYKVIHAVNMPVLIAK